MPDHNELNRENIFPVEGTFETAEVGDTKYVRDSDGVWRYVDSWIPVPGARDLTLTERFNPKLVISNGVVERVIVSAQDIEENLDLLSWVLEVGTPMPGLEPEVIVPFNAWQEHGRVPGEIVAPENSEDAAERDLAKAESDLREAEQRMNNAAARRAEALRRHAETMTRQKAREITGLSVGRVQQLIKGDTEDGRNPIDVDQIDRVLLHTIRTRSPRTLGVLNRLLEEETGLVLPRSLVKNRFTRYRRNGLVEMSQEDGIELTSQGDAVLDASYDPFGTGED